MLTLAQMDLIFETLSPQKQAEYLPLLNAAMTEHQINTPLRMAAFLAQLGHESADLRYFKELYPKGTTAEIYFKKYDGRKSLGNTELGDGAKYRGRGPIQLTGRHNYTRMGEELGVDFVNQPELAERPEYGFRTAARFFANWISANELADAKRFDKITRRINGGNNGEVDRNSRYDVCKKVLGAA